MFIVSLSCSKKQIKTSAVIILLWREIAKGIRKKAGKLFQEVPCPYLHSFMNRTQLRILVPVPDRSIDTWSNSLTAGTQGPMENTHLPHPSCLPIRTVFKLSDPSSFHLAHIYLAYLPLPPLFSLLKENFLAVEIQACPNQGLAPDQLPCW